MENRSQTEVPEEGNRENARKVIFEEIMALKGYLTLYLCSQSKGHQIPKNLYHIDCVPCPQYGTMRNR